MVISLLSCLDSLHECVGPELTMGHWVIGHGPNGWTNLGRSRVSDPL